VNTKKTKTWLVTLLAAMLLSCAGAPSWAYKITVTNGLSQADGRVSVVVIYGLSMDHSFGEISPGQTASYSNTDWSTRGLCWDSLVVQTVQPLTGCPPGSGNATGGQVLNQNLNQCRDIQVTVTRSRCNLGVEVK
jgi:hypothetical protein